MTNSRSVFVCLIFPWNFGGCSNTQNTPLVTALHQTYGTGSLGHRVNGSFGSSFTSGSPGHHFDLVWDPSFSGFRKIAQNAKRTFEMLKWQKSLSGVCCRTEITGCQSMQWTFTFTYMIIKNSSAWEYFFTHKSTFGVHYTAGSPGQLGLGSLDSRVTKRDPVPCLPCMCAIRPKNTHRMCQRRRQ